MPPEIKTVRTDDLFGGLNDYERKHAPSELHVCGDLTLLDTPRVSVIGTRSPSPEGVKRTRQLCRDLVKEGVTIVSGLAKGVDRVAHETALELGGRTIAVIGTGIDVAYPRAHADLQRRIAERHLLVSQFPSGTPGKRTNFPQRNRTMALLSSATVIVEAGETSGTKSQGWEALRLARPLFITRSVADREDLSWPKEMIAYGGTVLTEVKQVLDVLPPASSEQDDVQAIAI